MSTAPPISNSARTFWTGLLIIAAVFTGLTIWSWQRWPDVLIDFGPQLYIPWRITQGAVLYRDILYLPGGPLSQYFNALLFKLFGASFLTLTLANLTITAGIVVLIYRRFLAATDLLTAGTIALAIVFVFAFAQYETIGNYSYISPYCHEALHGLALSVLTVSLLTDWLTKHRLRFIAGAGFCAGLIFMTKPEIFLAASVVTLTAFIFAFRFGPKKTVLKSLAVFLLSALLPLLGFLFYFHHTENWPTSARSVAFAFVPIIESHLVKDAYYQWCLGLDQPGWHFGKMMLQFFSLATIVIFFAALFRLKTDASWKRLLIVVSTVALLAASSAFQWNDSGRCLPLLSVSLLALFFWKSRTQSLAPNQIFPFLWTIFGLAMLAKLGFFSRIWHYGFILAMPAFVSGIFLLLWALPETLERFGTHRRFFYLAFLLALAFGVIRLVGQTDYHYQQRNTPIAHGADRIMAYDNISESEISAGAGLGQASEWVEKNLAVHATLAVLPEGIIVNYLTRRPNPTHYLVWMPPEIAAFGQTAMTKDFREHSPDYVLFAQRDVLEYRLKDFGQQEQYGREVMTWIRDNYEVVHQIGAEPFKTGRFGVQILKRKNGKAAP